MSEDRLRRYLLNNVDDRGHWSRVESHDTEPGIPDMAWTIRGVNGWLELKYGSKANPPELRMMQYVWFTRNVKAGGNPYIFLGVAEEPRIFALLHGSCVQGIYKKHSIQPWLRAAAATWTGHVDWDEFLKILVTGQLPQTIGDNQ